MQDKAEHLLGAIDNAIVLHTTIDLLIHIVVRYFTVTTGLVQGKTLLIPHSSWSAESCGRFGHNAL